MPVRQFPQTSQEAVRGVVDAPLALQRLDKDPGGLRIDQVFDLLQVVESRLLEAGHQRLESGMVLRLPGRGDRRQGPAVE